LEKNASSLSADFSVASTEAGVIVGESRQSGVIVTGKSHLAGVIVTVSHAQPVSLSPVSISSPVALSHRETKHHRCYLTADWILANVVFVKTRNRLSTVSLIQLANLETLLADLLADISRIYAHPRCSQILGSYSSFFVIPFLRSCYLKI
jgi:hypothetical protein